MRSRNTYKHQQVAVLLYLQKCESNDFLKLLILNLHILANDKELICSDLPTF